MRAAVGGNVSLQCAVETDSDHDCSGIFGYINYLVEKDRKFILNTLINGVLPPIPSYSEAEEELDATTTNANT